MRTRILVTNGTGSFQETAWDKPEPTDDEIEVKAVLTGVCRSDIDMMTGKFPALPMTMSGHEGLGRVTKVGCNLRNISVGDYVATRGEPAYSDFYNVREREFVKVPSPEAKYIIEPVACGVNLIQQPGSEISDRSGKNARLLILGSGFLAQVAYQTLQLYGHRFQIDVVGNANKGQWGDRLKSAPTGTYDVVIDLSSRDTVFSQQIVNPEALVVLGAQKTVTTDFSNLLWKACTIVFPSPRTEKFYHSMQYAASWIENGHLDVANFWTKAYNRNTEWQDAFNDGLNRPANYNRGYIQWEHNA